MYCIQLQREKDELTAKLTVQGSQLTKLRDENRLLSKRAGNRESSVSVKLETEQVHS